MSGMGLWGGGWIMMIFWWILIIGGIIVLVNWLKKSSGGSPQNETPLEILKKRYARGEISKDEFDRMKKDIL